MPTRPSSPAPPPVPPTRRGGLIAIAAVVAVVIVIGAVVLFTVGGNGDDDDETAPTGVPAGGCAELESADTNGSDQPATDDTLDAFADDEAFVPVLVTGAALPEFSRAIQEGAPDIGLCQSAPVVSGYDYAGDEIVIDPARDGATMVVLLAHWCPHCNREIPVLNDWRDSGDVPEGLDIVGVSTGVDPTAANFPPADWLDEMDWQWPVLADSDAGADDPDDDVVTSAFRAYGGASFPTMLVIGSDGRLLDRFSGEFPVAEIARRVDAALALDAGAPERDEA